MKLYTKTGDAGTTGILNGERLPKDAHLVWALGELDELMVQLDKVVTYMRKTLILVKEPIQIDRIRTLLWQLGGELSCGKEKSKFVTQPITEIDVEFLESWIDEIDIKLTSFMRFENLLAIELNEARVRTRRLERTLTLALRENQLRPVIYKYINRLSDYLFALAVFIEIREVEF